MDIYWRDSYTCPTEDEYREMVQRSMTNAELMLNYQYHRQQHNQFAFPNTNKIVSNYIIIYTITEDNVHCDWSIHIDYYVQ